MKNVAVPDIRKIDIYRSRGGYEALEKALHTPPQQIVDMVCQSGLRGRGGAGYTTGLKWSFLPKDRTTTYLCVNADEAEPGTFCNRILMESDPHQVLEGIIISAWAIRAQVAYLYIRDEYVRPCEILQQAIDETYDNGLLGENIMHSGCSLDIYIVRNAGAYIGGEETGLIESIEGKRPWPRVKPPFPAVNGLFAMPTIVNNVETLACVSHIVNRGPDWFKSIGTTKSTGPKMFGISGHVDKPGCVELPLGTNLKDLIYIFGGGIRSGKKIKAVIPGGLSTGVLTAEQIDVPMAYENFSREINGCLGMGTGCIVVMDEDTDMLHVLHNTARFFATESCGQCTQCREGTAWAYKITTRMLRGYGRKDDLDIIEDITEHLGMMTGHSICGLADGAAYGMRTVIQKFRDELLQRIEQRRTHPQSMLRPDPWHEIKLKATHVRV